MATPTTLPATFVSGNVLTAAQMNDLRGAFRVLQVVFGSTATEVSNSTSTYADTTLTATITPQSTSSKVLVMVSQNGVRKSGADGNSRMDIQLLRGATGIVKFAGNVLMTNSATNLWIPSASCFYLDSPATVSATTYKTQFMNPHNVAAVSVQHEGASTSTIVLMEISA
jgi:hypothetical protein